MDDLLSKIYYSIKGSKRFYILLITGIHVEFYIGRYIYLNWRTFGSISPWRTTFILDKYKNLKIRDNLTLIEKESKIYSTEKFNNCSELLEKDNFLTYILRKSINKSIELVIVK